LGDIYAVYESNKFDTSAASLMVIGSAQAQVNQQENGVIQNNRSDRAEKRSERRENRASNKGRSQRISANRASGGRRK